MATNEYLDYPGLGQYHSKVKAELDKKVNSEPGKGLSTNDYTTVEKEKLEGLKNYILPAASDTALGGVQIAQTENPVPTKTALKADANGKAFVDWTEAPMATASDPGFVKLGGSFKVNPETGAVEVDASQITAGGVSWENITGKPDLATKADMTNVYTYKGSVATYDDLPTEDLTAGDVYNVEADGVNGDGMNYGWTGTKWDALGQVFKITAITNEQIDALFAESSEG